MKKSLIIILLLIATAFANAQVLDNRLNNANLLSTATISVTIGGDFPVTGSFPAFISDRVDQLVTRLYLEARERAVRTSNDPQIIRKVESKLNNYSLRGIILKRNTGEEISVDLQRFRITGDFNYNPYLKNDDVLIFPANDISRNFFTISGAVNKPGLFFFVEGDSLNDALEIAMGVNNAFEDVNNVLISRLSYDGETLYTDTVEINSNIKLKRGDRIKVLAPETQRKNYYVMVLGEIRNSGSFPITRNNTKLYDVIQTAGGFTKEASLRRAKLYSGNSLAVFLEKQYGIDLADKPDLEDVNLRNTIVNLETMLMYRMSNVYPEDSSYFFLENQLRVLTEGSSLDFTNIDDPESDISSYIVKSGDVIVVPAIKKSVYVFGQVAKPGYVPLAEGKEFSYYISEAGGMGELAVPDEIMVIKGGSRYWISPYEQTVILEEGDYVYVPKERLISFRTSAAEYAIYIGMLGSIATVILLIIAAFK
ncbi:MAG: SLBB domain-containing protein [Bacteroidetes bacterium]|nr:SLBB domain-containing protein [Bacteroidota bacterium]